MVQPLWKVLLELLKKYERHTLAKGYSNKYEHYLSSIASRFSIIFPITEKQAQDFMKVFGEYVRTYSLEPVTNILKVALSERGHVKPKTERSKKEIENILQKRRERIIDNG